MQCTTNFPKFDDSCGRFMSDTPTKKPMIQWLMVIKVFIQKISFLVEIC